MQVSSGEEEALPEPKITVQKAEQTRDLELIFTKSIKAIVTERRRDGSKIRRILKKGRWCTVCQSVHAPFLVCTS